MNRQDEISASLAAVRAEIPDGVTLIVVTKTFPISDIEILYQLGERDFGENRDSEGALKAAALPEATWHFQGGIQSNKLRSIVHWADYIHSLDDLRHARRISQLAIEEGKTQRLFIQVNLDEDPSQRRGGIPPAELRAFAEAVMGLGQIEVVGVMAIAPVGRDPEPSFARLAELSSLLTEIDPAARFISAGMSGDYKTALRYGATHIRIGSSILGSR